MEHVKKTKAPLWLLICVSIWLPTSMAAIYVLNDNQLSPFIMDETLNEYYDETSVTRILEPWLDQRAFTRQTAIHFYRSSCRCNSLVNKHLTELKKTRNISLKTVDLDEVELPFNLPATPALLVVDEQNQPKYFGAYGFGQYCQPTGNSIWAQLIKLPSQPSIFLNTIGKGCFCNEAINHVST